jgi:hypothetical protein
MGWSHGIENVIKDSFFALASQLPPEKTCMSLVFSMQNVVIKKYP